MENRRILLITERPIPVQDPGKRLRAEAWKSELTAEGFEVLERPVLEGPVLQSRRRTKFSRVTDSLKGFRHVSDAANKRPSGIVVVGLGEPHLLLIADRLATTARVVYDSCDSWNLQIQARREYGGSQWVPKAGALLQRLSRRLECVTYISARDALADAEVTRGIRSAVFAPRIEPSERLVNGTVPPLNRLVLVGDFTSFHNRLSSSEVQLLSQLASSGEIPTLEVFGKGTDRFQEWDGFVARGWAPTLEDIYSGSTGVIISNVAGSGIPNKYLEAVRFGKPILMRSELQYLPRTGDAPVYWWSSSSDLAREVRRMVSGAHGDYSVFAGPAKHRFEFDSFGSK